MVICEIVSPQSNMQKHHARREGDVLQTERNRCKVLRIKYARKTNPAVQVKHVLGG